MSLGLSDTRTEPTPWRSKTILELVVAGVVGPYAGVVCEVAVVVCAVAGVVSSTRGTPHRNEMRGDPTDSTAVAAVGVPVAALRPPSARAVAPWPSRVTTTVPSTSVR